MCVRAARISRPKLAFYISPKRRQSFTSLYDSHPNPFFTNHRPFHLNTLSRPNVLPIVQHSLENEQSILFETSYLKIRSSTWYWVLLFSSAKITMILRTRIREPVPREELRILDTSSFDDTRSFDDCWKWLISRRPRKFNKALRI